MRLRLFRVKGFHGGGSRWWWLGFEIGCSSKLWAMKDEMVVFVEVRQRWWKAQWRWDSRLREGEQMAVFVAVMMAFGGEG